MLNKRSLLIIPVVVLLMVACIIWFSSANLPNSDWPVWRYDANRSAASPHELPDKFYPQWVREYPRLTQAWEDPLNQDLMQFDKVYEPVVQGKTLFINSSSSDRLVALDTETGEEKWSFYADGPARFPPVAANGKVYFVSDDGYLYCVGAVEGDLIWKFRGGPSDRKILGNERLISTWPARGGPVIKDNIVYFASGIWPFMGVFIYALDAETGKVIWANDSTGSIYMLQPHNSPSYAGVAPQGNLAVAGDKLLVPCGRSVPACFDRKTGELLYYHLAKYNKTGGAFVCALGSFFINYHRDFVTSIYDLSSGDSVIPRFGKIPVMTEKTMFSMGDPVTAYDLGNIKQVEYDKEVKDDKTGEVKIVKDKKWILDKLWEFKVDASGDLIKAGRKLYAGGKGVVSAIDISLDKPELSWQADIEGTAARIIAADEKLFVVTLEGRIYAFGGKEVVQAALPVVAQASLPVESILKATGVRDGYCLVYGLKTGEMVEALAQNSDLRIIAVDPDPAKVDRLRRKFDAAGLYGKRISILSADPLNFDAPPYLASLTVSEKVIGLGEFSNFKKIYQRVRPYGGVVCLSVNKDETATIIQQIQKYNLPNLIARESEGLLLLVREGPLPGSDDWTHQYGDIANTVKSDDQVVKLPLGILWFGGSSNMDVLPRHGHGPPEQVVGGRLFIEGIDSLSARDVYTGRVLWIKKLPGLNSFGVYYDETYKDTPLDTASNQAHIPGANARGTNLVAALDKIYIAQKNSCLVLNPATGETVSEIKLPPDPETGQSPDWGYIGVYKDLLIAGAGFIHYTDFLEIDPNLTKSGRVFYNYDTNSSKRLVIMDRHTGKLLWMRDSELGFRHNAIAVGADKLFCIDVIPPLVSETLKRRGEKPTGTPKLMALDLRQGELLWSTTENVFGTWLSYSEERDVLIQASRKSRDMLVAEPDKGIAAYRGKNGAPLWNNDATYGGPVMLHGDKVVTDRYAYNLLTGKQVMRADPLTGEEKPWEFKRNHGCNYVIASEHLLTFRSAAGGFFDLASDGGTGNLGGFRSGCTSNLIAADGVLNAPDYTRTCSCSYQNQASLALVHTPDVEIWTDYIGEVGSGHIKSVGINLGAPGDRRADDGTLWLEYPVVGGPSPDVPVTINPKDCQRFIHHSSKIQAVPTDAPAWVVSSGLKGVSVVTIGLAGKPASAVQTPRLYTVRLYFSEPDHTKPGERSFDVAIQGQTALDGFDIVKEAGSPNRPVIKEFKGISVKEDLTIAFTPCSGSDAPLICGIELRAE